MTRAAESRWHTPDQHRLSVAPCRLPAAACEAPPAPRSSLTRAGARHSRPSRQARAPSFPSAPACSPAISTRSAPAPAPADPRPTPAHDDADQRSRARTQRPPPSPTRPRPTSLRPPSQHATRAPHGRERAKTNGRPYESDRPRDRKPALAFSRRTFTGASPDVGGPASASRDSPTRSKSAQTTVPSLARAHIASVHTALPNRGAAVQMLTWSASSDLRKGPLRPGGSSRSGYRSTRTNRVSPSALSAVGSNPKCMATAIEAACFGCTCATNSRTRRSRSHSRTPLAASFANP